MGDPTEFKCFGCYDENKFRSDGKYCAHADLTSLDDRIWRGSVLYPDRSINGHLTWNEILAQKIGVDGEVKVLGAWTNRARSVHCLGAHHYEGKDAKLNHPLTIFLRRVPYRGGAGDRAVWTCPLRLDDQDVITIMNFDGSSKFGAGNVYELWGPHGYVPGIYLAKEERIREIYPHVGSVPPVQLYPMFNAWPTTEVNGKPRIPSHVQKTDDNTAYSQQSYPIDLQHPKAVEVTAAVQPTDIPKLGIAIDLSDSSDDEKIPSRYAAPSSSLSSIGDLDDTHLTIPPLETNHVRSDNSALEESDDEVVVIHHKHTPKDNSHRWEEQRKRTEALGKYSCQYCDYQAPQTRDIIQHENRSVELRQQGVLPRACSHCGKKYCGRAFTFHRCPGGEDQDRGRKGKHLEPGTSDWKYGDDTESSSDDWADQKPSSIVDKDLPVRQLGIERIGANGESAVYQCGYCDYDTELLVCAERHQASADKQNQTGVSPQWSCDECKKVYCFHASLAHHRCAGRSGRVDISKPAYEPQPNVHDDEETHRHQDIDQGVRHVKIKGKATVYQCSHCDYEVDQLRVAERHQVSADRQCQNGISPPWSCSDCGKVYCHRNSLTFHQCPTKPSRNKCLEPAHEPQPAGREIEDSKYGCQHCDYRTDSEWNWRRHEELGDVHRSRGEGPVVCDSCKLSFCTTAAKTFHKCGAAVGQRKGRRSFAKSFTDTDEEGLSDEYATDEADFEDEDDTDEEEVGGEVDQSPHNLGIKKEPRHFCGHCSYGAFIKMDVTRHEHLAETLREKGEKPLRCKECNKTYCTSRSMGTHRCQTGIKLRIGRINSNRSEGHVQEKLETRHYCEHCSYESSKLRHVLRHEEYAKSLRQQGIPPRVCACGNTYCTDKALAFHHCEAGDTAKLKTNVSEDHGCSFCSFRTGDSDVLSQHQSLATRLHEDGVSPIRCPTCNKTYCGRDAFQLHLCHVEVSQDTIVRKRRLSPDRNDGRARRIKLAESASRETIGETRMQGSTRKTDGNVGSFSLTSTDSKFDYSLPVLKHLLGGIKRPGNALSRMLRNSSWKKSDPPRSLHIRRGRTLHDGHKRRYVSTLIQLFGEGAARACDGCENGSTIFVDCVARSDMKDGTCGNCAFAANPCSLASRTGSTSARFESAARPPTAIARPATTTHRQHVPVNPHHTATSSIRPALAADNTPRDTLMNTQDLPFTKEEQSRVSVALSMRDDNTHNVTMPFEDCETLSKLLIEIVEGPFYGLVALGGIRAIWLQAGNGPDDSKLHLRPSKSQSSESYRRFLATEVKERLKEDPTVTIVISAAIEVLKDS